MRRFRLNKKILVFRGAAAEFVNAYATNVPEAPLTAFIDVRGHIVATAEQTMAGHEVFVAVEAGAAGPLQDHLQRYLPLFNVRFEELPCEVYFSDEAPSPEHRVVFRHGDAWIWTDHARLPDTLTEEEFRNGRLDSVWPLQGVDYGDELLLNLGDERYVNYEKGCYLGQEVMARVHFRAKPPRRLAVKAAEECSEAERSRLTSTVKDPRTGRTRGFLFVENTA